MATGTAAWRWNLSTGAMTWSSGAASILGLSEDALPGTYKEYLDRIPPADRERLIEAAAYAMARDTVLEVEHPVGGPGQPTRWMGLRGRLVRSDGGDQGSYVSGLVWDVGERRRTEQANESRFRAWFDSAPVRMILTGPQTRILRANRAFCSTVGREAEAVLGMSLADLAHSADAARVEEQFRQLSEGRAGTCRLEFRVRGSARGTLWMLANAFAVREAELVPRFQPNIAISGRFAYAIVMLEDLTEQRQLERAIADASSREKRRIGRDLHDGLGQELTGAVLMVCGLERKLAANQAVAAEELARLRKLLKEAAAQTQALARGLSPVDQHAEGLPAALRELATYTREVMGVECTFVCDSSCQVGDRTANQLYRIAQEAITNAAKHASPRRVSVELSCREDALTLTVTDDGRGLPADRHASSGMGLRIMGHRAQLIGGTVEFERAPGGGTRIVCRCPRRERESSAE